MTKLPDIVIGTQEGAYRLHHGAVTPLGAGGECVTALLELGSREFLAGTYSGCIYHSQDRGSQWSLSQTPNGDRQVTALFAGRGRHSVYLAGTADGQLWQSTDQGKTFEALGSSQKAPQDPWCAIDLGEVPGEPHRCLISTSSRFLAIRSLKDGQLTSCAASLSETAFQARIHPTDPHLWLIAGKNQLWRSADGGESLAPTTPLLQNPRRILFEAVSPFRVFVLTSQPALPPAAEDRSTLWVSNNAGLDFEAFPAGLIDRPRDPSGEITCLVHVPRTQWVIYATDRGELLSLHLQERRVEMLAEDLPPIATLILTRASELLDPSASGIYVLP